MPIQRIPRYIMLLTVRYLFFSLFSFFLLFSFFGLKDLLNHTDDDHRDKVNIQKAVGKVKEVADFVNESIKLAERVNKIVEIQTQLGCDVCPCYWFFRCHD